MALQKNVNVYEAAGVAGDRAAHGGVVINTPQNYLAGEGGVTVGGFVWEAEEDTSPMTVVANGSGAPLGFVERIVDNTLYNVQEDGTLVIPEGGRVTVAVRGDFYVVADATVTKGASVYADTSTGAANFSSTGEETTWKAVTSGEEGDLIIISNWA